MRRRRRDLGGGVVRPRDLQLDLGDRLVEGALLPLNFRVG